VSLSHASLVQKIMACAGYAICESRHMTLQASQQCLYTHEAWTGGQLASRWRQLHTNATRGSVVVSDLDVDAKVQSVQRERELAAGSTLR